MFTRGNDWKMIGKLAQLLPHVITEQEVTAAAGCTSRRKFVKAKRWKV